MLMLCPMRTRTSAMPTRTWSGTSVWPSEGANHMRNARHRATTGGGTLSSRRFMVEKGKAYRCGSAAVRCAARRRNRLLYRVVLSAFSGVGKYYIGTDFEGESRIVRVRAHETSAITNDGVNHALACFVVKRAPLRVHAEQHYGIQAHEYRSVFEPNCPRELLRSDVVESGRPKVGFQRTGVAKAVTTVGDRSDVSFRNTAQPVQQRQLLVRTPGAHAQSATFCQSAMHLPGGWRSTHEELKPLLT